MRRHRTPLSKAQRTALRTWLGEWQPWTLFGTGTYQTDIGETALRAHLRAILRDIAKRHARAHVPFVVGWGEQSNGRLHSHLLVATPLAGRAALRQALPCIWSLNSPAAGYSSWANFDPTRGAIDYVLSHENYDLGIACNMVSRCRRAGRCLQAPTWR